MTTSNTRLFSPIVLGGSGGPRLELAHRIVLAPLTRSRADDQTLVPNVELVREHYKQRATPGGLLISEATNICQRAKGEAFSPGIFRAEHVDAWRQVVQGVKEAAPSAVFFCQLWHTGRQAVSYFTGKDEPPISASAIARPGSLTLPNGQIWQFEVPYAPTDDEIRPLIIEPFVNAAKMALKASFDGVELHWANAYCGDQFLQNGSNTRPPPYGGSAENRVRLLCETLDAMLAAGVHSSQIGVRFSPYGTWGGMSTSDPEIIWPLACLECAKRNIAYVHCTEPPNRRHTAHLDLSGPSLESCVKAVARGNEQVRSTWNQPEEFKPTLFMTCGRYLPETAEASLKPIAEGGSGFDLVAIGRLFISNPDLVERFRHGLDLTRCKFSSTAGRATGLIGEKLISDRLFFFPDDTTTFYTQSGEGYTDYPTFNAPDGPFGKFGKFTSYLARDEWEPEVAAEASSE